MFVHLILLIIFFSFSSVRPQRVTFEEREQEFEQCLTNDNENGVCVNIKECRGGLTGANRFPKLCRFTGVRELVICCPLNTKAIRANLTVVPLGVEKPASITFDCGIQPLQNPFFSIFSRKKRFVPFFNPDEELVNKQLVAGGLDSQKEEWPWMLSNREKRFIPKLRSKPQFDASKPAFPHLRPIFVAAEAVGGVDTLKDAWPWMALFGRKLATITNFFCDGVLINDQFVLTAAHCLLNPEPFFVRLGEHDYDKQQLLDQTIDVQTEEVEFYPEYKLEQGYHDLALVKLDRKITIQNAIRPICLPWGTPSNSDLFDKIVTITGWGAKFYGGPPSPILQEVLVTVFNPEVCRESYSTLPDFTSVYPQGMNEHNILCAGDKEGGKDACQGDSGGPLVHMENGKWILGGIISKGYGCGHRDFPGLYAPIRNLNYLKWIKSIAF